MADNNDAEKMTAAADEAAGKKFKLSEIVEALHNHDIELDCKAVLACYTDEYNVTVLDVDLLDIHHREDVLLLTIQNGLAALMHQANEYDPKALSVLVEADARRLHEGRCDSLLGELSTIFDGKEGADHE